MTSEKSPAGWYFLLGVILLYIIISIFKIETILLSLQFFVDIIVKILPVLVLIFVLMALTNYYIRPKMLVKLMGKGSGIKGWAISIIAGIISSGPIYMWYPLLSDLQRQGMRNGLIAGFLYNRAVKIPLLPLLIMYFGLVYTIVLMIVMIIMSVFQGIVVEKIVGVEK